MSDVDWLRTAAEIVRGAPAAEALAPRLVQTIQRSFDLYAVRLFRREGSSFVCVAGAAAADSSWRQPGEAPTTLSPFLDAVMRSGQTRRIDELAGEGELTPDPSLPNTCSVIAVPVRAGGHSYGALLVESTRPRDFGEPSCLALELLAGYLGRSMECESAQREAGTAEAKLQSFDRCRREFTSLVGHDIRNPLAVIRGYAELIELSAGESPELIQANARRIVTETAEISRMAEQILSLLREESSTAVYRFVPMPVLELLDPLRALADDMHAIVLDAPSPAPLIRGDARSLLQVLRNLLTNAIHYSPGGGPVTVRAEPVAPDRLRIEVSDEGIGISEADRPRLFRKFERIYDERTEGVRGMGLGLYLSRRIIEAHGGEIAHAPRPDGGSTFFFTLPIVAAGL